jgi:hypothetical protein
MAKKKKPEYDHPVTEIIVGKDGAKEVRHYGPPLNLVAVALARGWQPANPRMIPQYLIAGQLAAEKLERERLAEEKAAKQKASKPAKKRAAKRKPAAKRKAAAKRRKPKYKPGKGRKRKP